MHPDQVFVVKGRNGPGDQPQQWWRTFEKFLIELLRAAGTICTTMLVIATGGLPGSLCGILGVHVDDQVNGGRGTRWENAMKRLRARFSFRKWITDMTEVSSQTPGWNSSPISPLCSLRRRMRLVSSRLKRDGTQNLTTVALHSNSAVSCVQRSEANGWLRRHGQI